MKDVFHTKESIYGTSTHTDHYTYWIRLIHFFRYGQKLMHKMTSIAKIDDKDTNLSSYYSLSNEKLSDIVIDEYEIFNAIYILLVNI